jgi:curved DNA-binding protein CbpA
VESIRAVTTLGVGANPSPHELRRAYRRHLQRVHPDTGSGDVRSLEEIRAAYRELAGRAAAPQRPASPWDERPAVGRLVDVYG